jgi:hypothetical protein
MGRAGRARALTRFPEDRCVERTEEVYRYWLAEHATRVRLNGGANGRVG